MTDQKKEEATRDALKKALDEARVEDGDTIVVLIDEDDEMGMLPCSMNIPDRITTNVAVDPDMIGAVDPDQPDRVAGMRRVYQSRPEVPTISGGTRNRYDDIDD